MTPHEQALREALTDDVLKSAAAAMNDWALPAELRCKLMRDALSRQFLPLLAQAEARGREQAQKNLNRQLDVLVEEVRKGARRKFYEAVNRRAEADMLAGRPITGAHHRALEAEIKEESQ
jgi:hypothetical protein